MFRLDSMIAKNIDQIFNSFPALRIGIIGDAMVDAYVWGTVDRISPEAPVPVVSVKRRELRMGGASNVAMNLQALGVQVQLLSVMGCDTMGDDLKKLFTDNAIKTNYLIPSSLRRTTCKTRVICHNQQMIRLDEEIATDLAPVDEEQILKALLDYIENEKPHLIIFEDYNKGVLTERVISEALTLCQKHGVITAVDPKKKNFFLYCKADIIKPNYREVKEVLGILSDDVTIDALKNMHRQLRDKLQHQISLISLSEKGIFYQHQEEAGIVPSHVRQIADVSGAGDTVIAVGSAVYAVTKDIRIMAEIANIAGGLVCEEVGTAIINIEKLFAEAKQLIA